MSEVQTANQIALMFYERYGQSKEGTYYESVGARLRPVELSPKQAAWLRRVWLRENPQAHADRLEGGYGQISETVTWEMRITGTTMRGHLNVWEAESHDVTDPGHVANCPACQAALDAGHSDYRDAVYKRQRCRCAECERGITPPKGEEWFHQPLEDGLTPAEHEEDYRDFEDYRREALAVQYMF